MSELFHLIFYQPILNLLVFFYNIIPGNDIGVAIVMLTALIRLISYPLNQQSIKSQKALRDLQPKIDELKRKYADNKQEQGRAMMELYKTEKVNPFSSCLPLLIQFPFLIAVYYVFRDGLAGNNALDLVYSFLAKPESLNPITLGFFDLSKPSIILAVIAGVAQFWQVKMMSVQRPPQKLAGAKDEDMMAIMNKQMIYFMPILTVFFGFTFPAGLMLYWLVTTLLTGLQQLYIFKNPPINESAANNTNTSNY
ncbi:hypothetical protein COU01_04770 [Candidatus Falkowbacteria bacterium CG10_big_fil_rev_8_21_14_0_10_44_15]|uniref:Membrane insertase YidC/Oxa/ALB C-terminal domain-containing protein n=1 Tax=Candidatus Falkowbacteria bacterium CG10_big_fil_rev_8_21_14_0_10_44_15 TaxID=1974569 RepID=A0A2H0UYH0_9BACT|nr:MAG: hypothetical protein COU01_04770 [Candidatus Falkowbacteria bacterium CG10_big_fil_rev_8_21_14_0_10_44_15]